MEFVLNNYTSYICNVLKKNYIDFLLHVLGQIYTVLYTLYNNKAN